MLRRIYDAFNFAVFAGCADPNNYCDRAFQPLLTVRRVVLEKRDLYSIGIERTLRNKLRRADA
jgi:hypothetical protein